MQPTRILFPLIRLNIFCSVIRTGTDALFLTGGEPLTHLQIGELVNFAKSELRFQELTLITNGLLILTAHETCFHCWTG